MQLLGSGGYGSVVALDEHRVCKLQASDEGGRCGISTAALREMVALRVLEKVRQRGGGGGGSGRAAAAGGHAPSRRVGRILLHPSGVVGIEIRRYPLSLLDWLRGRKRRRVRGSSGGGPAPLASPSRILGVLADVAAELAMAHAHGYIHRDVKPENVMFDAAGRAHLIDWGMSRFAPGGAPGRWTPGVATVWYRAPELFTGDAYGSAVDVWALGVMVVELVTGRCPFRGRTELEQATHYAEVLGPPPADRRCLPGWPFARGPSAHEPCRAEFVWAQVPEIAAVPGLPDLVDRMIRWDPAARITAAQLLLHPALQLWARGAATQPARRTAPALAPLPRLPRASALRAGVRAVILPGCLALGAPLLPVGWCAALLLWRTLAAASGALRALSPLTPLLCVDLAAKLVGTQTRARGLVRSAAATRMQVRLVNRHVGVAGLADGAERACAPLAEISRAADAGGAALYPPGTRPWARLLLEAALLAAPERVLPHRDWRRLAPCLLELARHILTGLPEALARCRAAAGRLVRTHGAPARATLRAFAAGAELLLGGHHGPHRHGRAAAHTQLWRRAAAPDRAALIADLERDPVRQRRLALGLAAMVG
jgi:hypothetical protein